MIKDAILSPCRKYRYVLWRTWDEAKPTVMFVGLNPSAADEFQDDPTIRRCINFAKSWGFGGLCITNLYGFRHHDPTYLFLADNPIGDKNDYYLKKQIQSCDKILVAWGNDGLKNNRFFDVLKLIDSPFCLKINKSGQPAHPLYMKADLKPIPYRYDEN